MRISDWSSDVCSSDLIGLQTRPHLYDYNVTKAAPLAPREWRFEITERITADGSVLLPLDEEEVVAVAHQLAAAKVERSEERRGGKECVRTGRFRWSQYH